MKACVAVLLIASAVCGQLTTGVDKNVFDFIKYRQMYPQGQNMLTQQQIQRELLLSGLNKFPVTQQEQIFGGDFVNTPLTTLTSGVNGVNKILDGVVVPSTLQFNIPSDVTLYTYTLRQLVTMPIFQEYMTLPIFRQYINTPAFQLYLTSGEFQKFFTQPIFRQFFVDPVLFYKYVLPVVQQYGQIVTVYIKQLEQQQQQQFTGVLTPFTTLEQQQKQQMIYNYIKPTIMNGVEYTKTQGVQTPFVLPNNMYTNFLLKNLITKNLINKNYDNFDSLVIPQLIKKDLFRTVVPEMYKTDLNMNQILLNKINLNKNILDVLVGDKTKMMYTPSFVQQQTQQEKTVETLYLEKIIKDLIQGKINIDDLKIQNFVTEKVNQIIDPVTGDVKIVEDKIVKPLDTLVEGEMNLNKVLLKKNIFNKY